MKLKSIKEMLLNVMISADDSFIADRYCVFVSNSVKDHRTNANVLTKNVGSLLVKIALVIPLFGS